MATRMASTRLRAESEILKMVALCSSKLDQHSATLMNGFRHDIFAKLGNQLYIKGSLKTRMLGNGGPTRRYVG